MWTNERKKFIWIVVLRQDLLCIQTYYNLSWEWKYNWKIKFCARNFPIEYIRQWSKINFIYRMSKVISLTKTKMDHQSIWFMLLMKMVNDYFFNENFGFIFTFPLNILGFQPQGDHLPVPPPIPGNSSFIKNFVRHRFNKLFCTYRAHPTGSQILSRTSTKRRIDYWINNNLK